MLQSEPNIATKGPIKSTESTPKILVVGSPNVGKSLLFSRLTGRYVTVSNYPGTTVEITRGRSKFMSGRFEVVDTPGMYSLSPITEEEQVTIE
ncbi:MAG: 50S ribosome-binding GTPase, partial [Deltaproteobacteria bacterium]|nr:50S ribosome-binding GTPase [Deltaproteobacteria bacterium]